MTDEHVARLAKRSRIDLDTLANHRDYWSGVVNQIAAWSTKPFTRVGSWTLIAEDLSLGDFSADLTTGIITINTAGAYRCSIGAGWTTVSGTDVNPKVHIYTNTSQNVYAGLEHGAARTTSTQRHGNLFLSGGSYILSWAANDQITYQIGLGGTSPVTGFDFLSWSIEGPL